jgi:hypothetical protein
LGLPVWIFGVPVVCASVPDRLLACAHRPAGRPTAAHKVDLRRWLPGPPGARPTSVRTPPASAAWMYSGSGRE